MSSCIIPESSVYNHNNSELDITFKLHVYRKAKLGKKNKDFIVVNKTLVIQNLVILYKNQLDNGLPLTGIEKYGGIIVFDGILDIRIFESEDGVVDDRFMMPLYLRAWSKASLEKHIESLQSRDWDKSFVSMYLIKSRLIVSIYSSLRSSVGVVH